MELKELTKITAILRGYELETVRKVCQALVQTQEIRNIEVTMNTSGALEIIQQISQEFGQQLAIGAGTVMTLAQAEAAHQRGAQFFLSPTLMDQQICDYARARQVLTISGALSPTEVWQAAQQVDVVKVFPATSVGNTYFKDIKAPLGQLRLMAVGGVNQDNGKSFLENGADYLGVGGIFKNYDMVSASVEQLAEAAKSFEKKVVGGTK